MRSDAAPRPHASAGEAGAVQRRTIGVLVASQALGGLGTTIGIAVAAVLAEDVSGRASLAGLVQTMQVVGAAFAAYLLARLMGRRGRRIGLAAGYLVGATGAAVVVLGGVVESFGVLLLGALLLGANSATNYQSRYAATDLATPQSRGRALAVVLWATTLGAVLGPNLVGPAGDLAERLTLPRLTGPFMVSTVVVLVAALLLTVFLRPDPLLLARQLAERSDEAAAEAAGQVKTPVTGTGGSAWRHTLTLARERPGVAAAILAMSASHAVMVGVMIMTPLHMSHGGATLELIGLVVSVHVLGMFFFAPVVGLLVDRAGRRPVLALGAVLLLTALLLSGSAPAGGSSRIGVGLFLLGLGWSCCTVSASTLLVELTPTDRRTDVQGVADMVMNLAAAAAGVLAGVVVDAWGFTTLNAVATVLVAGVVVAVPLAGRASDAWEPAA